ncbi:MAG: ATP synthase subunit b [Acidimicrobiales bacterium]|nr:ATP synthase subunit b [Acidimicrobiales bacterium]
MPEIVTVLASEEPNASILPGDLLEVLWGSIAFLVVVAVLYKFAWGPLIRAMHGRTERIGGEMDDARAERDTAEAGLEEIRAKVAESKREAARIIEDARRAADAMTTELAERAEAEAADVKRRAESDLETAREQAFVDLEGELSRLAVGAAEVVVVNTLDDAAQQQLIDDYINRVGAQN